MVDPEAADVVKRIFAMTIDGYGPYQIASKLKSEKVLIPSAYLAQHGEGVNKNKTFKDVYGWGSSTICNILEKREYLGHTINFKTRKHFKTRKAIMSRRTNGRFSKIPMKLSLTSRPLTLCRKSVGMSDATRTAGAKQLPSQACFIVPIAAARCMSTVPTTASVFLNIPVPNTAKSQLESSARHSTVSMKMWYCPLVSEMLKAIAEYAKHDRAEFVRVVQEAQSSQQTAEVRKQRTRLATAKQRVSELEVLLCKIYEDNILGKLSDSRYATLDAQYEKEQSELTAEISVLEKAVRAMRSTKRTLTVLSL